MLLGCYLDEALRLTDSSTYSITLTGTHLQGIQADNLSVDGSIFLDHGFNAEGLVSLIGAKIDGALICTKGVFNGGLSADSMKVDSVAFNDGFQANGVVSLVDSKIDGQLLCTGGTFDAGLVAASLKVGGVFFNTGFKVKVGDVNLMAARIDGQLVCAGGIFDGLKADGMKAGSVGFDHGFTANGEVSLIGAKIDGALVCTGGTFLKGFNADSTKVGNVGLKRSIQNHRRDETGRGRDRRRTYLHRREFRGRPACKLA